MCVCVGVCVCVCARVYLFVCVNQGVISIVPVLVCEGAELIRRKQIAECWKLSQIRLSGRPMHFPQSLDSSVLKHAFPKARIEICHKCNIIFAKSLKKITSLVFMLLLIVAGNVSSIAQRYCKIVKLNY